MDVWRLDVDRHRDRAGLPKGEGLMGLLARLLGADLQASYGPTDDHWYQPISAGGMAVSGQSVNPDKAQTVSAFFRGLTVLSNDVAKIPLELYERKNDGKQRARGNPLYDILHTAPNEWQTSYEWRRQGVRHLVLRGNWYNRIMPGRRGPVDQLWPLNPDLVTPEQLSSGRIVYHVRNDKTHTTTRISQDDIMHVRGPSDDGVTGKSVLAWARDSVGIALATESYAGRLFSQGNLHGGTITVPGLLHDDASKRMAQSFVSSQASWHMPKVLEQGATYTESQLTPEDSQFLLSRKFSVTEMARWLGLPPHKIFDLERSTNNNIEHQGIEYVGDGLQPWCVLIEQAILRDLVLNPARFFAEFNLDGLLRGDSAARGEFYSKMFNIGALSQNDIRTTENRNKIPDGDKYYVPANLRPTDVPYEPPAGKTSFGGDEPSSTLKPNNAKAIAVSAAARVLRKETETLAALAAKHARNTDGWAVAVTNFYAKHASFVSDVLQVSEDDAKRYCAGHAGQVIETMAVVEIWVSAAYAEHLAEWALGVEAA
jgi:HK97 family phage portal protein